MDIVPHIHRLASRVMRVYALDQCKEAWQIEVACSETMNVEGNGDGRKYEIRESGGGDRRRGRCKGAGVTFRGIECGCINKAVAGGVQSKPTSSTRTDFYGTVGTAVLCPRTISAAEVRVGNRPTLEC